MVLVSLGALGAAAPTDFQKDWFCTLRISEEIMYSYTHGFHDFNSKVILLSDFPTISENLHP